MSEPSRKWWWPRGLYELRPKVCLAAGAVLGAAAIGEALYEGAWPTLGAGLLALGCVVALYGGITQQLRGEYRRSHPGQADDEPGSDGSGRR